MINPLTIENQILTALDSEGSDRYPWNSTVRDAVNYAIDYVTLLFDKALADDKISEESLREISWIDRVFINGDSSSFDVYQLTDLHSIVSIYPEYSTVNGVSILGGRSAKRLTAEEWGSRLRNCFMAGNDLMNIAELRDYAYLSPLLSNINGYGESYVAISPKLPNGQAISVVYLKTPNKMVEETSDIELDIPFPTSVSDMIVQKALTFIGQKEAGTASTYEISSREIQGLTLLMT